jgi:hypothetical protein
VLITAVVVAVVAAAVITAFALGGRTGAGTPRVGTSSSGPPQGTCRVPSGASAGTETPPGVVARVLSSLGRADVTFTRTSGGTTVYVYCYDAIDGGQLGAVSTLLSGASYTKTPGQDATQQVVFQHEGKTPYGIALTVTGTLNASQPGSGDHGGLSVTWVDTNPG